MFLVQPSPAKVNLRLKITARDARGYHRLSMLNAPLSFGDRLELELCQSGLDLSFTFADRVKPDAGFSELSTNLAYRAAEGLLKLLPETLGLRIKIHKEIPLGAGLAGGSSNAAAVLIAGYSSLKLSGVISSVRDQDLLRQKLFDLAGSLGSDVPFFLYSQTAWVGGFGSDVRPQSCSFEGTQVLLVLPAVYSNTSDVYQDFRELVPEDQLQADLAFEPQGSACAVIPLRQIIDNDLLPVVLARSAALAALNADLRGISGVLAGLSGSGSAFFLLPADGQTFTEEQQQQVTEVVRRQAAELVLTEIAKMPGIF